MWVHILGRKKTRLVGTYTERRGDRNWMDKMTGIFLLRRSYAGIKWAREKEIFEFCLYPPLEGGVKVNRRPGLLVPLSVRMVCL